MAVGFNIKVVGMGNATKFIKQKGKLAIMKAGEGVKRGGSFLYGEVKKSIAGHRAEPTSVDTGRFLNSIQIDFPTILRAKIWTGLGYAKFLEYGTTRISPRRHFGNTKTRNEKKVIDFIKSEVKKI